MKWIYLLYFIQWTKSLDDKMISPPFISTKTNYCCHYKSQGKINYFILN